MVWSFRFSGNHLVGVRLSADAAAFECPPALETSVPCQSLPLLRPWTGALRLNSCGFNRRLLMHSEAVKPGGFDLFDPVIRFAHNMRRGSELLHNFKSFLRSQHADDF